jgi:hypothetical protein
VLKAGFHVHDDGLVPADYQVGNEALKHDVFRAYAAAAPGFHCPHKEELDPVFLQGKPVGYVVHFLVYLKEFTETTRFFSRSRAFSNEFIQL